jgi:hypothetical protein
MSQRQPLYFNNRLCSGTSRSLNSYTKNELLQIAKAKGVKVSSKLAKREICQILINSNLTDIPQIPPRRPKFESMDELMKYLDISDAREFVKLSDKELEELIDVFKIYSGKQTMRDHLKNYRGSERVKQLLIALAEKFCRCLKVVEASPYKTVYSPTAVCSSSIFAKKNIKGPGSNFQCSPTPLLLPSGFSKLQKLNKDSSEYREAKYILKHRS